MGCVGGGGGDRQRQKMKKGVKTDRQTERDREGELHSKAVVFQLFCR